jgi:hypothetical protein
VTPTDKPSQGMPREKLEDRKAYLKTILDRNPHRVVRANCAGQIEGIDFALTILAAQQPTASEPPAQDDACLCGKPKVLRGCADWPFCFLSTRPPTAEDIACGQKLAKELDLEIKQANRVMPSPREQEMSGARVLVNRLCEGISRVRWAWAFFNAKPDGMPKAVEFADQLRMEAEKWLAALQSGDNRTGNMDPDLLRQNQALREALIAARKIVRGRHSRLNYGPQAVLDQIDRALAQPPESAEGAPSLTLKQILDVLYKGRTMVNFSHVPEVTRAIDWLSQDFRSALAEHAAPEQHQESADGK